MDKFVIYDGVFRPPKKASGPSHRSDFSLKSGSGLFQLGTLNDIEERSALDGCPLCKLVVKSLDKHTDAVLASLRLRGSICFVNWEIDGRDNDPFSGRKARTRRLHLRWNYKNVADSYLVFVVPKRLFEFNSDSRGSWEREAFFLGRELETGGNNQVLMKSWLDQCSEHHGPACSGDQSDEFHEMVRQSYFGVIDCLDMCIKSLPVWPGKTPKKRSSNQRGTSPEIVLVRRDRYGSSPSESPVRSKKDGM